MFASAMCLIELGLGLEVSNRPFIWVLREKYSFKPVYEWIEEEGFEQTKDQRQGGASYHPGPNTGVRIGVEQPLPPFGEEEKIGVQNITRLIQDIIKQYSQHSTFYCSMGSLSEPLHFVLFPFMAQGHLIPMTDIARLLAQREVIVTIVTTPVNAARVKPVLDDAIESGFPIRLVEFLIPFAETGIPEGCETLDKLPREFAHKFFTGINSQQQQQRVENFFEELRPSPSCIISDFCLYYTRKIATKFQIPRISFQGFCGLSHLCNLILHFSDIREKISSDSEYFIIPGLSEKFEFTKAQMPMSSGDMKDIFELITEADLAAYGEIINTFDELESPYVEEFRKRRGGKVWSLGPVSLSHEDKVHKSQRGGKAAIDEDQCLKWLDIQEKGSVIYVCLGSLCNMIPAQLIELGLGLEASNRPFIWVLREKDSLKPMSEWIEEEGFEQRTKGRGLIIRGWAPQLLILSHPAVGGFLTHCGWNSTLEGICSGVPMITWPLFADQFCNEKVVVQVAKTGVRIGVEQPLTSGEEEKIGVQNITQLIQDIKQHSQHST